MESSSSSSLLTFWVICGKKSNPIKSADSTDQRHKTKYGEKEKRN
jgi:hypothetical protein